MTDNYNLAYIIDDDPIFVLLFKKMLSKMGGFNIVKNLENGQMALDTLLKNHEEEQQLPDIIFLDINMPVLDGWQFLEILDKYTFKKDLKIYVVSSSIDKNEIEKAKTFNFVKNFISKPISVDFLEKLKG